MFSDLADFRQALDERLATVPASWRRIPKLSDHVDALTPCLYTEFTEFTSELGGPLGRGTVAASADLVVVGPKTTAEDAEDDVDADVLALVWAVDGHDDIAWSTAKKERLEGGQLAWRISLTALVSTHKTTDPEGE